MTKEQNPTPPPVRKSVRKWHVPPRGLSHSGTYAREFTLHMRSDHTGDDPTPAALRPEAITDGFKHNAAFKKYRVLVAKLRETVSEIESLELDREAVGADLSQTGNAEQLAEVTTNLVYLRGQEAAYRKDATQARAELETAARDYAGKTVDAAYKAATAARDKAQRELLALLESNEALNRYSDANAAFMRIKTAGPTVESRLLDSFDEIPAALPESQPAEA